MGIDEKCQVWRMGSPLTHPYHFLEIGVVHLKIEHFLSMRGGH